MWVHPYQARVSTMEEVVKQLTPLISTGSNWPYALVQLNGGACHAPLPKEGHLSVLVEGSTSSVACRRISQLEVCQLLSLGSQAVYPVGPNGCEVPMIPSLHESLAKDTTMLRGKPIYLLVDILQSTMKGQEPKAPSPGGHSIPILNTSPIRAPLPKVEGQVSMTTEVRELLSQAVLDTSGHASGSSTPKRLEPMVLVTPLPPKLEDFPKLVDTSFQVGTPDDAKMDNPTLEEVHATYSPTIKTPGSSSNSPPLDIAHLWEEVNKALGDWLVIKSSIDAHQQKLVSKFSMTLCGNESKTGESIKEAKALCAHSTREAEANHAHSIKEAEACCSTAIREAETWGASQASSIQQSHARGIQHLEEEAVEEEIKGQLNFLSTCQAALEASPLKSCGMLIASYQVLLGHTLMFHLFSITQGASPSQQGSAPMASSPSVHTAPRPSPRPKWQHHSPDPMGISPLGKAMSQATP